MFQQWIFNRSHTLLSSFKVHSSSSGSALLGSGEFNIQQYMKQFTHTKPQRYRSLRTEWRNNVYLRRSNIQVLILWSTTLLWKLFITEVIYILWHICIYDCDYIRTYLFANVLCGCLVNLTLTGSPILVHKWAL